VNSVETLTIRTGAGNDVLKGTNIGDTLSAGAGWDQIFGYSGNDTLDGGDGNDSLYGGSGIDVIRGGAGDDIISGSSDSDLDRLYSSTRFITWEADILDGGTGIDTLVIDLSQTTQGRQISTSTLGADFSIDGIGSAINFEVLRWYAGSGDDIAQFDSILGSSEFVGGAGFDQVRVNLANHTEAVRLEASRNFGDWADLSFGSIGDLPTGRSLRVQQTERFEVYSGSGADLLEGLAGSDLLSSGAGVDFLSGREGNDVLIGGAGADTIDGGQGTDNASWENATSGVYVLVGDSGAWTGDTAGDQLTSVENFRGSGFNDTLGGDSGSNRLEGLTGDDVLLGRGGSDVLVAGLGVDTASYALASSGVYVVIGDNGNWTGEAAGDSLLSIEGLIGSNFNDVLGLDAGNNVLQGRAGNDYLLGYAGNDILIGGAGGDMLDGGAGTDTASYSDAASRVYVFMGDGGSWTGDAAGDTFTSIENLTGSAFNDILGMDGGNNVLDGGAGDDVLFGQGGGDTLIGGAGFDTASYATATSGVYVFYGDWGSFTGDARGDTMFSVESILGSNFNDIIGMDDFANTLAGGGGDDILYGEGGGDRLFGNAGFDTVSYAFAPSGVYILFSDLGNATGDAAGDSEFSSIECIVGSAFDDIIGMGDFNDTLGGGGGNDVLMGNGGGDRFFGNDGFDTVSYGLAGSGVYIFFADLGNATGDARGDSEFSSIESIVGSNFNDVIGMGDFADTIIGGGGNDILLGMGGNDTLWGGAGNDLFAYTSFFFGTDTIRDFQDGLDRIDFSRLAGATYSGLAITSVAGGTQVALGTSTILLSGINTSQITAADFLFA